MQRSVYKQKIIISYSEEIDQERQSRLQCGPYRPMPVAYEYEMWTLNKEDIGKWEALEMWLMVKATDGQDQLD